MISASWRPESEDAEWELCGGNPEASGLRFSGWPFSKRCEVDACAVHTEKLLTAFVSLSSSSSSSSCRCRLVVVVVVGFDLVCLALPNDSLRQGG